MAPLMSLKEKKNLKELYQKKKYTNFSKSLLKIWKGGNSCQLFLWGNYHPDDKAWQKTSQEKKITKQYPW